MGLDTVELVLEAEERFGIEIPDKEASQVRTVGEFHNLILRKLGVRSSQRCLTAVAFYRLRRAFAQVLGTDRRAFHPERALADLLPFNNRRNSWPLLARATALLMPPLCRPAILTRSLTCASVIIFFAGILLAATRAMPLWVTWGAGIACITLLVAATRPLAVYPLGKSRTVGDLARAVFDLNVGLLAKSSGEADQNEIWRSLVRMVSEQLGVRVEEITPASRFVEDLNCG